MSKTFTADAMPPGYVLVRYGLLQWGWRIEQTGYSSVLKTLTARGSRRCAQRHAELMAETK